MRYLEPYNSIQRTPIIHLKNTNMISRESIYVRWYHNSIKYIGSDVYVREDEFIINNYPRYIGGKLMVSGVSYTSMVNDFTRYINDHGIVIMKGLSFG